MINLQLSPEEALLVQDVLGMWCDGIDAEVAGLSEQTDEDAHWSKYQLRKQYEVCQRVKLRIELERRESA